MFSQHIYNFLLKTPYNNNWDKILYHSVSQFRQLSKRIYDPLIDYKIGNNVMLMPFSHNLGIYQKFYPQYAVNVGRIAAYTEEKNKDLTIIDIGANVGDTVFILRSKIESPILAIEGDEYFYSVLQKNIKQLKNVSTVKSLIGDQSKEIKATLAGHSGTAGLEISQQSKGVLKIQCLTDILEKNQEFQRSKLMKIDTDGLDGKIIRGAIDWIRKIKPVIFFEYDPFSLNKNSDDGLSLFNTLASAGYKSFLVYNNFGEYMYAIDKKELVIETHQYFSGRQGRMYCDLCAFSDDDIDLFEKIRRKETEYSLKIRGGDKIADQ